MKYTVIGGAGFIGSHLVDKLLDLGHEVVVLDNLSSGKAENVNKRAKLHRVNIELLGTPLSEKIDAYKNAIMDAAGSDAIFHLAAKARVQPSIEDPVGYNKHNVNGTLSALELCKNLEVRRFIYSASSSAYGDASVFPTPEDHPTNPQSPYGLQKLIGEEYCKVYSKCYGIDTVSLRYFNVYGDRFSSDGDYALVLAIFLKQKMYKKALTITGDGTQKRDFTFVGDVVNANILAMESSNKFNGDVINIGNGDNVSINEVADLIGGEKKYIEARQEPKETLADRSKAKELLGWEPSMTLQQWIPKYLKQEGL
jgi:UDP-glucose 4-epimerase